MATGGSEFTSDEIKSIKCCLCLQENRTTDADKYCTDCKDYYCTPCVSIHQKIGIMKGHKIQDKAANNLTGSDRSLPSYPTQRCPEHRLEVISAYCKDHDEVACAICMCNSTLHRSCGNILSIPEIVDDLYEKCNLTDIQQKIHQTKTAIEDIKKIKQNKLKELNKALNTEIEAVKAFRQELDALLDNMEQETIKELRRKFSRIEASFTGEITSIESLLRSLDETALELKKADGNKAQEFVCVKSSKKLFGDSTEIQKCQQMETDEKVFFTPDHSIKTAFLQIKGLGKVQSNPKQSLYKVKKQRDICVRVKSDRSNCSIWGSCITENGYLLLADWSNQKLKRIDLSTETVTVVDYIKFQNNHPLSVCAAKMTEAAVALNNNSIQFVSLGDKMAATRALKMIHSCNGLAHKDSKLFISDHYNNVYVYDIDGQQQNKLSLTLEGPSLDLFSNYARYYAVCASGNRVFVAHHQLGLVVLDSEGNNPSTHKYDNESGCRGVCSDGRNIFVFVYSNNKIVQIGPDIKMLGDIETVQNITTLCFDNNKMRLIATVVGSDNIKVLELE